MPEEYKQNGFFDYKPQYSTTKTVCEEDITSKIVKKIFKTYIWNYIDVLFLKSLNISFLYITSTDS